MSFQLQHTSLHTKKLGKRENLNFNFGKSFCILHQNAAKENGN